MWSLIKKLLAFIIGLFHKTPVKPVTLPLTLPHLPEPPDYSRTIGGVDVAALRASWFSQWGVPESSRSFWNDEVKLYISLQYPYAAATFSETREIWLRPEWADPGVLAHEAAHISYALLTGDEKEDFKASLKASMEHSLVKLLARQIPYFHANAVEAHAEIYRYLGEQMPWFLRKYYPKLIDGGMS